MGLENKDKKGKGILIIIIIIIAVFGLLFFLLGIRGILKIFQWFFIIMTILAIFGLLIYFIWYFFFKKQKYDVTFVNKQKLLDACHKGYTSNLKNLYIGGDKGHSRINWGKITGYCRISVLTREMKEGKDGKPIMKIVKSADKKSQKEEIDYTYDTEEQDVFSVTHRGFLLGLFEEQDIVRVEPKKHDELIGDITLYGFSLIPHSEYWYLNTDNLDMNKIDYAIKNEAWRGLMFEMLRDSKEIIDKASGLDADHQKRIEERSQYEIPIGK